MQESGQIVDDEIKRLVREELLRRRDASESSRLRPFIADTSAGPGTALSIQGFRDEAEIHEFWDTLVALGVFYSKERPQ